MIKITNLCHLFKGAQDPTLKDINLQVREREHLALIGPNGSGKTTLVRHLNALITPQSGEVEIDGLSCRKASHHAQIRRMVGMVFQNPDNQIVGMTVEEDIAFGPGNLNMKADEIRQRVTDSLQMVGLAGFEKRSPFELSGGEKQLLALAGLLALNPRYIVLDETTSSLDPGAKGRVYDMVKTLQAQGIGIIQVTHNMEEAARADRVVLMKGGLIIADGSPAEVLTDVDRLKKLGLAPPPIVELISRLNVMGKHGIPAVLSVDQAADWLNRKLAGSGPDFNNGMNGRI
ncbi:MAG: ATP-binding cassette domain-containing protein [Syntrophomonadaceae bacterium]|nr:ATP-binding cassette domain-containing protein [Syntrophomonadaceae bacterium]